MVLGKLSCLAYFLKVNLFIYYKYSFCSHLFIKKGSGEKLIVHVKTYKDIQSSENNKDIKGTPRYLCLTRKVKNLLQPIK